MNDLSFGRGRLPAERNWQVIVIGAGVAGALAALRCVKAGFETLLVDKQSFPRHKVCGCCLNPKAWRSLEHAGVAAKLLESANAIRTTRFHVRGSRATVQVSGMQAVSRSKLDSLLVSAFVSAGGTFAGGTTATVLPGDGPRRIRLQQSTSTPSGSGSDNMPGDIFACADVVLACDGLGHPSLKMCSELTSVVSRRSRVGVGVVIPRSDADTMFPKDELQMAVGNHGYVGTVEVEDGQLSIAAAVDAQSLKAGRSPLTALQEIYDVNGLPAPENLSSATIKGTLPLTRSTTPVALPRIFLLGDAVGYVEPLTGEGMAWAMTSADLVVPLVEDVVTNGWHPTLPQTWANLLKQDVQQRQNICRLLSRSLRFPWLLSPMVNACRLFPAAAESIVRRMNHVPSAKKV
jgi:flavin-dependent dehydrogenase